MLILKSGRHHPLTAGDAGWQREILEKSCPSNLFMLQICMYCVVKQYPYTIQEHALHEASAEEVVDTRPSCTSKKIRLQADPGSESDKKTVDDARSTKFRNVEDLCMCSVQNILEYYQSRVLP